MDTTCRRWLGSLFTMLIIGALATMHVAKAAPPRFAQVTSEGMVTLPQDNGAHPDFRTEWWYATGWLTTPEGKPLGFQITFFALPQSMIALIRVLLHQRS